MSINEMRARILRFDITQLEEVAAELEHKEPAPDMLPYNRDKVRRVVDSLNDLHRDLASQDGGD